ncbi:alpha/beta fold hydrolase [Arthrobacter sp. UYCu712]|uniref:alpha/beta fold hydrolase n=1 Tax=Arthrobacter sp. UYCu712 TaxID=3156340 RepID=UPI003390BD23
MPRSPGGEAKSWLFWSELIPLLADQRQVIAVEEEGHGRTQPTSRPLTAENSAGDVLAVLDQLNVETVDVLGFSAGGHTAIALGLGSPAVVRRLIAASTFASRGAVPAEFWDGMAKATLDDMPDTYKDADRRLNPEPGHLGRLFELDRRRILDFPRMARRRARHHHGRHAGGERRPRRCRRRVCRADGRRRPGRPTAGGPRRPW